VKLQDIGCRPRDRSERMSMVEVSVEGEAFYPALNFHYGKAVASFGL